jgi:Tol biopolymer transport system component/predicted Ser/Thr protein kinase
MIGKAISHYRILEELGQGGMGVVYRAHDTKLDRDVALKFLPPELTKDPIARERFIHEAKAASALSHPNVCAIHEIQDYENQIFIVMDFVDGQTLRKKLESINFKQAIDIAIQIADGLAAAHERGIIHRDIKPENIMIRRDGIAQIMDFGLAKLRGAVTRLTKEGSTVGTVGYMSPEQVQGLDVDHRSDIFSFGVLLYEMLSGELPFKGLHETALAYEIVNVDAAPMSSIKPEIDPQLDALVLECLEKDPRERTQSIAQVGLDLKRYKRETSRERASRVTAARRMSTSSARRAAGAAELRPSAGSSRLLWTLAAVFFVAALTFGILYFKRPAAERRTVDSYILPPDRLSFVTTSNELGGGHLALSPDGAMLAFVAVDSVGIRHLMVRALHALDAKELPATKGATYPFWSPDSRHIGFFQSGKLKKIEASGGPAVTICEVPDGRGGSWNREGVILFSSAVGPVYRVPAEGGAPAAVTAPDTTRGENSHRWPEFLPDGKRFLYFSRSGFGGVEREQDAVCVGSLDGKLKKRLMHAKGNAEYASGYLIYLREKTLMAQPFNLSALETSGEAISIAEPVEYDLGFSRAVFSVSQNGTLVYQASTPQRGYLLEWFSRAGASLGKIAEPLAYTSAALSPDGGRIAFDLVDSQSGNMDVWIYDVAQGLKSRFTFDPAQDDYPIWSPDAGRIVFTTSRKGQFDLYVKATSGAGVEEPLLESTRPKFSVDWSPDGRFIAYADVEKNEEIWIVRTEGDRKPFAFLQTGFDVDYTHFSPDGRWIAYESVESGKWELYVRPFLGADGKPEVNQTGKWQVSTNGVDDSEFRWNPNGKELIYFSEQKLLATEVGWSGSTFGVGATRSLIDLKGRGVANLVGITPDGRKLLIGVQIAAGSIPALTLVTNWDAGLKKH